MLNVLPLCSSSQLEPTFQHLFWFVHMQWYAESKHRKGKTHSITESLQKKLPCNHLTSKGKCCGFFPFFDQNLPIIYIQVACT